MARMFLHIRSEGFELYKESFRSIIEAATFAHLDDIGIELVGSYITFQSMRLVAWKTIWGGDELVARWHATPAMILFIAWLMTRLPARATVIWRDGWPFVSCPPCEDGEEEPEPLPLDPDLLVPIL